MLMQDRLKFLGWSLAVNLLMFVTFIHNIITYQLGSTTALLQLLGFVLNAVPPLLVSLLVVLRFLTVLRLRHQRIFLSDTRKLQTAAQLDLVLFDKTGTLTVGQVGWFDVQMEMRYVMHGCSCSCPRTSGKFESSLTANVLDAVNATCVCGLWPCRAWFSMHLLHVRHEALIPCPEAFVLCHDSFLTAYLADT